MYTHAKRGPPSKRVRKNVTILMILFSERKVLRKIHGFTLNLNREYKKENEKKALEKLYNIKLTLKCTLR